MDQPLHKTVVHINMCSIWWIIDVYLLLSYLLNLNISCIIFVFYCVLLHTHINILNLISRKNVTWHLTFRPITRWTLSRMFISNARDKTSTKIPLWASRVSKSDYFPWYTTTTWRYHLVYVVRFELDQMIMALCRIFDVIKQLSTL